ncbi:hypothetical protein HC928_09520 [bacterium]|nr:hypothetical protein [bacterium]
MADNLLSDDVGSPFWWSVFAIVSASDGERSCPAALGDQAALCLLPR